MAAEDCTIPAAKAPMHLTLRCGADPLEVRAALGRVRAAFAGRLCQQDAAKLELALAEVMNNVVEHAYAGHRGRIALSVGLSRAALLCRVTDRGAALPGLVLPRIAPPGNRPDDVAALSEGGWGWHLLQSLTRDIVYARTGSRNRLSFRIDLGESCPTGRRPPRGGPSGVR